MSRPVLLLTLLLAAGCGVSAAQPPSAVPDAWTSDGAPTAVARQAKGIAVVRAGAAEWRLLWADDVRGLRSATSTDLRNWREEPGYRVEGARLRHPAVVEADGRLSMVVQEGLAKDRAVLREYSSVDGGLTWTPRGVAVGQAQGFDFAGASAMFLDGEGRRALLFSGTPAGRTGLGGIYLATAGPDGAWTVSPRAVAERAHSPTVVPMGQGQLALIFRRGLGVEGARSRDGGRTWVEAGPVRIGTGDPVDDDGATVTLDRMGVPVLLVARDGGIERYREPTLVAAKAGGEHRQEADLYRPAAARGPAAAGTGEDAPGATPAGFPAVFQDTGVVVAAKEGGPPIAPEIVRLSDGRWRMFYLLTEGGIRSAVSDDGLRWTLEPGDRLARVERRGTPDGLCGHPAIVRVGPRKLRMYYQGLDPAVLDEPDAPLDMQLFSAVSEDDGLTWRREGLAIGTGERWGLDFAGHARAWVRRDGTFAMVLSGNRAGDRDPSSILMATSTDGREWVVRPDTLFPQGHDPALVQLDDGRLVMVYDYLRDGLRVTWSDDDGETWSPPARLAERTADGRTPSLSDDETRGDVALLRRDDGEVVLFVSTEEGIVLGRAPGEAAPGGR